MVPTKKDTPYVPVAPNEIIEQTHQAYEMGMKRMTEMKTGTIFGGKEAVGITIEELFQRELKQ